MRLRAITHIHGPSNWLGLGMSNACRPCQAPSRRFLRNDAPRQRIHPATRTRRTLTATHKPPFVMTPETRGATRATSRSERDAMNTRASNAPHSPPAPGGHPPVRDARQNRRIRPCFTAKRYGLQRHHPLPIFTSPAARSPATSTPREPAKCSKRGAEPPSRRRPVGQRLRQHIRRYEATPTIRDGSTTKTP